MAENTPKRAAVWFQRVTWIGIFVNLALAIPTLLAPARMLQMASLPPATPLIWTQTSALFLILLSLFYTPGAIDCYRFMPVAWMAVGSRLTGVIYFAFQPSEYRQLGAIDLVFFVPEAILLWRALRGRPLPRIEPTQAGLRGSALR